MYYLYVLKSTKDNKFYIGRTNDLERRLKEHNDGLSTSTSYRRPLTLMYYEAYISFRDAQIREVRLKQFKNGYKELMKRLHYSLHECKSGGGEYTRV